MYSQTHVLVFDFQLLNQFTRPVNALLSFAMCLAGGQVLGCRHQEVILSFHGNEIYVAQVQCILWWIFGRPVPYYLQAL